MKFAQFRIDAGEEALKIQFVRMTGNANYTCPMMQNEIFAVASSKVVEEMIFKADELYVFVVAHESTDVSGKKQLSIVLRHIKSS